MVSALAEPTGARIGLVVVVTYTSLHDQMISSKAVTRRAFSSGKAVVTRIKPDPSRASLSALSRILRWRRRSAISVETVSSHQPLSGCRRPLVGRLSSLPMS